MTGNQVLRLFRRAALALSLFLSGTSAVWAQRSDIPMEHHSWGRFAPGAWQHARIMTKTFDKEGKVVSTTTRAEYITLLKVRRGHARLRIESMLEVGGKTFEAPVRTVSQGYHGEDIDGKTISRDLGEAKANVEGETISCQVQQYEITKGNEHKLVTVYYSTQVAPYVLRRNITTTISNNPRPTYRTNVQVVALDRPHKVLDETKPTAHLKTIIQNGKSATVTLAVHAEDVPGEIVGYVSEEKDPEGNLIRQSVMELIDYGYTTSAEDLQFTRRRDWRKYKRSSRRRKK